MADIKRIRLRIAELAQRRKNVELSELEWVVKNLGAVGYDVHIRKNDHATLFRVSNLRFSACHHHPGNKQLLKCYVDEFLNAMEELGLYED